MRQKILYNPPLEPEANSPSSDQNKQSCPPLGAFLIPWRSARADSLPKCEILHLSLPILLHVCGACSDLLYPWQPFHNASRNTLEEVSFYLGWRAGAERYWEIKWESAHKSWEGDTKCRLNNVCARVLIVLFCFKKKKKSTTICEIFWI